jgi:multidrug efflux pump subunit AcrA (membrane-fusion protein)
MLTDTTNESAVPAVAPAQDERRPRRGLGPLALVGLAAAGVALGVVIYTGIRTRVAADAHLAHTTVQAAVPTVNVVYPHGEAPTAELVLPGTIQAFTDAPIYARTNSYLKRWYVGIGAHVKQGELLAEIDTPKIDQQLRLAGTGGPQDGTGKRCSRHHHRSPLAIPRAEQLRIQAGN